MQPPFPSPVSTWHNDVYPAIDPAKCPTSHEGQTVIITGAGGGVGRATAKAYAAAGAKKLVLIGRTTSTLKETASEITGNVETSIFTADVTDEAALQGISKSVGTWNVLILNAGYTATPSPAAKADIGDYWKTYETNVKSAILFAKHFFPTANPAGAFALAIVSGAMCMPVNMLLGQSAYICSKLALVKTMEYLSLENPGIFCAAVHPGMVDTKIFRKSGATPDMLPMDDARLVAAFLVWLTLGNAQFLNGKLVWSNWDIEGLTAKAEEISAGPQMTAGIYGWPFTHASE